MHKLQRNIVSISKGTAKGAIAGLGIVAWITSSAFGQTTTQVKKLDLSADKLTEKDGWTDLESVTGGSNVIDQQNVNGQQNGTSTIYNLDLSGDLNFRRGQQSSSNSLTVNEAFSRTPALPRLIKSTDQVRFVSMYRYQFAADSLAGLFGRFKATTAAFESYDERAAATTYVRSKRDGSSSTEADKFRAKLAAGFAPQEYKEAFGLFLSPFDQETLRAEVRGGPAALQTFAKDAYFVNTSKSKDGVIVLEEVNDVHAFGAEMALEVKGVLLDKKLDYLVSAEALYPLVHSLRAEGAPEASKLVNYETLASLRYKLNDWLGFTVQAKSKRNPMIRPEAEVVKSALLTATLKKSFLD
ncbi:MAG: hypothetical protein FJ146_10555 [Deltaproteobacteria bacterium]|nr:hypothetical protein [Deltaproteobacteria bacterium]